MPSAETLAAAFGAGTVLLAVAVSLPQFLRLWRGDTAAGVSLPAVVNSAISFLAWTLYALSIQDGWLIASSALGVPFAVATAVAAWRSDIGRAGLWIPATWSLALLTTGLVEVLGGWELVHLLVGASIGWLVVPAVVTAWCSRDVSGIAPGSWWVLAAEGLMFLGYGLAQEVSATIIYGVVALAGSAGVLARLSFDPYRSVVRLDSLPGSSLAIDERPGVTVGR